MATHINPNNGQTEHDSDEIKDILMVNGFSANQATAAIANHMFGDAFRSGRRWRRNHYITTTNRMTITGDNFSTVLNEILAEGVPTRYAQTGTPVTA